MYAWRTIATTLIGEEKISRSIKAKSLLPDQHDQLGSSSLSVAWTCWLVAPSHPCHLLSPNLRTTLPFLTVTDGRLVVGHRHWEPPSANPNTRTLYHQVQVSGQAPGNTCETCTVTSEKDPDLFLMGPRRGTVKRFTMEDEISGATRWLHPPWWILWPRDTLQA